MTRNRDSSRLRLQTAMARCAQLCATASRSAAVTIKAFGHPAIAVIALDLRKRSSFVFSIVTLRHIRHLHTLWVRKCCMSRSVLFLIRVLIRRGTCFYAAKVCHGGRMASAFMWNMSKIFLSEQALKEYFRDILHEPSECHAVAMAVYRSVKSIP